MKPVVMRPLAADDADAQFAYLVAESSLDVAWRFLDAVENTIAGIAELPAKGSRRYHTHPRLSDVRVFPVKGFERVLVFYQEFDDHIDVIRILHSARDLEQTLDDGF